jgi:hypothetical protein
MVDHGHLANSTLFLEEIYMSEIFIDPKTTMQIRTNDVSISQRLEIMEQRMHMMQNDIIIIRQFLDEIRGPVSEAIQMMNNNPLIKVRRALGKR